jgi:hypothetical protein
MASTRSSALVLSHWLPPIHRREASFPLIPSRNDGSRRRRHQGSV